VLGVGLAVQVAVLVVLARGRWFVGDDWDFLMTRGTVPGESRGWFEPHAEHWSTGVIAIYRVLFSMFGMRHYLPYGLVVIVLHVGICVLIYALLLRVGTARWPAVAATWVVVFLGAGAEALLWDTPMNLLSSLLLGLVALLVCARSDVGQRQVGDAWLVLSLSLIFSGAGITVVALVAVFVAVRLGVLLGLRVAAVPAAVFLIWFAIWGHEGSPGVADSPWIYTEMPAFVWTGLTHALTTTAGIPGSGAVILLGLVALLVMVRTTGQENARPSGEGIAVPSMLRDLAVAGLAAALLQLTLAAATPNRLEVREQWAVLGRYAYLTVVLLTPLVAIGMTVLLRHLTAPRWLVATVGAGLMVMYAANAVSLERVYHDAHRGDARAWPERLTGIVDAVDDGQEILTTTPGNWLDRGVDPEIVITPTIRKALPPGRSTPEGRLDAEINHFVGVGPKTYGLFDAASVDYVFGWGPESERENGCETRFATAETPVLELDTGDGNEIGVFSNSTRVTTKLERDGEESKERTWKVKPGTVHIATSAKDATLVATFNKGGDYLVCTG
jgi:hypothetical protein